MSDLDQKLSFCHALIESFGPETSNHYGSAVEEPDEEAVGALLAKMESLTQNYLLFGPCLDRLTETGLLASYLCSLLTALPAVKSSFVPAMRQFIYFYSMKSFSQTKLSQEGTKILRGALQCNDCYLNDEQIELIVENSLTFMKGVNEYLVSQSQLASFNTFLEILVTLALKSSGETKRRVHRNLLAFNSGKWPSETILMLSSNIAELCDTEEDCDIALKAMMKYVHWNSTRSSSSSSSSMTIMSPAGSSQDGSRIAPDNLPALLYVITSFRTKCNNLVSLKKKVAQLVITAVDTIMTESSADFVSAAGEQQVRTVLSTITHHLSLLVTKDGTMVAEVVTLLKNGDLLIVPTVERGGAMRAVQPKKKSRTISKAKLLLCLLVARSPNQEEKIIKGMTDMVKGVAKMVSVSRNSLWFPAEVWKDVLEIRVDQLFDSLEQLVVGPLMANLLAVPLTTFAFSLLSDTSSRPVGGDSSVVVSVVGAQVEFLPQTKGAALSDHSVEALGIHLLLSLFKACEHSRIKIIEDIGVRLLIASDISSMASLAPGSSLYHEMICTWPGSPASAQAQLQRSSTSSGGSSTSDSRSSFIEATSTARACIRVLSRLSKECAGALAYTSGSMKRLEDIIFDVLGRMPPVLCEELIIAITPLFDTWKPLFDKCMMCVNKACLSRDLNHRQAALVSKVRLIDCQTAHLRARTASSHSSSSSSSTSSSSISAMNSMARSSEARSLADSIEDNCAELRRFLQHQGEVRAMLYDRMYKLQCTHVHSRPHALFLLFSHLMSLTKYEDDRLPCTISENRRNREYADLETPCSIIIDLERCIDSSGFPVERLSGLLVTLLALASEALSSHTMRRIEQSDNDQDDEEEPNLAEDNDEAITTAVDVCQHLWLFAQSATTLGLFDDFGLVEDGEVVVDRTILGKEVMMIDMVQALSTVVANLPSSLGGRHSIPVDARRIQLGRLAQVHAQVLSFHTRHVIALKKSGRKNAGKKRKKKRSEEGEDIVDAEATAEEQIIDGDEGATASKEYLEIVDDLPSFSTEDKRGLSLHVIRARISYATFVAEFLFSADSADWGAGLNDVASQSASQVNEFDAASSELTDTEAFLLTRSALESALISIESLLNRVLSLSHHSTNFAACSSSSSSSSSSSLSPDSADFDEVDQTVWSTIPMTITIMNIVLQNSSQIAPSELRNESLDIGSCFSDLSVGELAFRCLLGLFRLHAMCGARRALCNNDSSAADINTLNSNDDSLNPGGEHVREEINARLSLVSSLITNPVEFARTGRAFLMERPLSIKAASSTGRGRLSTGSAVAATDLTQGGSKDVLGKAVRVFVDILSNNLELYYSDSASKQVKSVCSKCSPLIVPIISELMQYLQDAKRMKYLEKFVVLCDGKVQEPSKALTRTLFKHFVYASNNSPEGRRRQLVEMSSSIKTCMSKCDDAIEYNDEQDMYVDAYDEKGKEVADYETTCRFVCRSSLKEACEELLGAVHSVISDTETLLRLSSRAMKATKQKKAVMLSLADDKGHILSDDDDNSPTFSRETSSLIRESMSHSQPISDSCVAIKTGFRCANDLVMPKGLRNVDSIKGGWKGIVERTLRVYTQLYSLQGNIASSMLNSNIPSQRIEDFRKVAIFVGEKVTHAIDELILDLQQGSSYTSTTNTGSATKKKRKNDHAEGRSTSTSTSTSTSSSFASGRQETLVPNLVYTMAQLDAKVVSLSKKHKTIDFTKALPRNVQRDFKFNENVAN